MTSSLTHMDSLTLPREKRALWTTISSFVLRPFTQCLALSCSYQSQCKGERLDWRYAEAQDEHNLWANENQTVRQRTSGMSRWIGRKWSVSLTSIWATHLSSIAAVIHLPLTLASPCSPSCLSIIRCMKTVCGIYSPAPFIISKASNSHVNSQRVRCHPK